MNSLNILAALTAVCTMSCTSNTDNVELRLSGSMWVPKHISWTRPLPNDEELGEINYSSFDVVVFKKQGQALIVTSTNSLGEGDTISMATEPGVRIRAGNYTLKSEVIMFNCQKQVYTLRMIGQSKNPCEASEMTLKGNSMFYNKTEYVKYSKFNGEPFYYFWDEVNR